MKDLYKSIKTTESKAQKIIDEASLASENKLQATKADFENKLKQTDKKLSLDNEKFINTAKQEAQKQADEIQKLYDKKIDSLDKIDKNQASEIVIDNIINN